MYFAVVSTTWTQPPGWTGSNAVLYQSFDSSDGVVLKEGTTKRDNIPRICGKVETRL